MFALLVLGFSLGCAALGSVYSAAQLSASSASSESTKSEAEKGKQVFRARCARCHLTTSTKERLGPGLKGLFKTNTMIRSGLPPTEENVRKIIWQGSGSMQPFRGLLSREEMDNLMAYLKAL